MKLSALMAGVFGTVGFVLSVMAGLMADNGFDAILLRALLWCGVCYAVGYIVGSIGQVVTQEHASTLAVKAAEYDAKVAEEKEAEARKAAAEAAENPTATAVSTASPVTGG